MMTRNRSNEHSRVGRPDAGAGRSQAPADTGGGPGARYRAGARPRRRVAGLGGHRAPRRGGADARGQAEPRARRRALDGAGPGDGPRAGPGGRGPGGRGGSRTALVPDRDPARGAHGPGAGRGAHGPAPGAPGVGGRTPAGGAGAGGRGGRAADRPALARPGRRGGRPRVARRDRRADRADGTPPVARQRAARPGLGLLGPLVRRAPGGGAPGRARSPARRLRHPARQPHRPLTAGRPHRDRRVASAGGAVGVDADRAGGRGRRAVLRGRDGGVARADAQGRRHRDGAAR